MLIISPNSGGGGGGNTDRQFQSSVASSVGLSVKRIVGQTAKLFGIYDESDAYIVGFNSDGSLELRTSSDSNDLSLIRADAPLQGLSMTGDSANRSLRFRSEGYVMDLNKAGISFFQGTSSTSHNGSGSAASPTYRWRADTNTGIFRAGVDEIGFTCGGVSRMNLATDKMQMNGIPIVLGVFATGDLPSAAAYEGAIVYDSTTQTMKFSNGATWTSL